MNASISMVEYTIIIDQCNALKQLTLPLFALCEHQSQAWIKEEGDVNCLRYHTVSLNCN